jgi:hypothetical protein
MYRAGRRIMFVWIVGIWALSTVALQTSVMPALVLQTLDMPACCTRAGPRYRGNRTLLQHASYASPHRL